MDYISWITGLLLLLYPGKYQYPLSSTFSLSPILHLICPLSPLSPINQ